MRSHNKLYDAVCIMILTVVTVLTLAVVIAAAGCNAAGDSPSAIPLPAAHPNAGRSEGWEPVPIVAAQLAQCVPSQSLIEKAERFRALNDKPPGYGRSWRQILLFFGVDHAYNGTDPVSVVTVEEMVAREGRWSGWQPFRVEVERLLACGWTPGVQAVEAPEPTPEPEPEPTPEPEPQPLQAEPQKAAPTGYEAWVTQTPDQDYAARFRYDVPEGLYKTYDVTVHVQLTPADATVDGVVVYLHAPGINNLLHSGALIGAGTTNTHIPASSTEWTHRGNGHYTRVVPVTFNSVDDDVVSSNYGLGDFEIHTIPRERQTKRGASGSEVTFFHQEDDLTYPRIANVTYTSTMTGTYAVVTHRMATAKLRVVVTPSGSASVTPRGELWTDIPANSPDGTEINEQHNGNSLYFSCPVSGDGWLTLTPHWNTPAHIDPNHSHTVKVCPRPPPPSPRPPPTRVVSFSAIQSYGDLVLAGQTLHGDRIGEEMTGFMEVSGSASIKGVASKMFKFTLYEHGDGHELKASAFGPVDSGANEVVRFNCGSGSGWARILYFWKGSSAGDTVPYAPFRWFKVCN